MFNIVNIVIVIFLGLIIHHFLLNNKESFDCDVKLNSLESCFRRTQKQNGLKINEAKSTKKQIDKIINDVKKMANKHEAKIGRNRQGVVGLQQN